MLTLNLNALGLYTFPNAISQVPPGAMAVASNVVIDRPGVVETRRGFKQYGTTLTTPIYKLFPFQNKLIAHHSNKMAYDSDGAGTWTDYGGTFSAVTNDKIRGTTANQNFYFTTNNGIYKIDTITNAPYQAGGVAALDTTVVATGVTGFLATPSQCAYRITWSYTDSNNNLVEGNPSMATTLSNSGGTSVNASVTFTVPSGVTTSYTYRLYRTPQTNSTSIPPGDTFQLSYQGQPTGGEIAAGVVTVTDSTVDLLLGSTLYTSPGAQGQFQTNDPPPLASDICFFQGMMFYANCSTIQQFYITMISVGAPNGVQINDTISLVGTGTRTYTGKAANNFASQQFKVDTSSTIAQNIDATARNLVSAINQDPGNTEFYAYYVSGFSQLPGQILIKARNLSHAAFTATASRGGAFSPTIPSAGVTYISSNNTVLNGVYVSKLNQPEAVPATNLIFVGAGDQAIYRVFPLRGAVIVDTAGGVFRITGTSPSTLTVTPFDTTTQQYGNDTGVVLNNSVYCFTSQGIVTTTESGTQIMSRNVEGDLLQLSAPAVYTGFKNLAFAISYESDRKYILGIASATSDIVSTLQYVYNWATQAFTTWNLSITHGVINPFNNLLYLAGSDGQVLQERKSITLTDYADREYAVTVTSSSGKVVQLVSAANAVVGQTLAQHVTTGSVGLASIITAVNLGANQVTVADVLPWFAATAGGLYTPINSTVTYSPLTCGYPNYLKRFTPQMQFVFSQSSFSSATVGYTTDLYSLQETVTIAPKPFPGWDQSPWDTTPWDYSASPLQMIPAFLTKNTFIAHWLSISVTLNQAFQNLALDGISGFFDILGERFR